MATSGHIMAQRAHPVHLRFLLFSFSVYSAGRYPFMFSALLILMDPFGHATMQRPQPLHSSLLILIKPLFNGESPKKYPKNCLFYPSYAAMSR